MKDTLVCSVMANKSNNAETVQRIRSLNEPQTVLVIVSFVSFSFGWYLYIDMNRSSVKQYSQKAHNLPCLLKQNRVGAG